jgi:hypothetical protein
MDCYNRITGLSNFDYSPIENMSAMAINSNSHQNTSFFHCHLLFSTIYQSINLKSQIIYMHFLLLDELFQLHLWKKTEHNYHGCWDMRLFWLYSSIVELAMINKSRWKLHDPLDVTKGDKERKEITKNINRMVNRSSRKKIKVELKKQNGINYKQEKTNKYEPKCCKQKLLTNKYFILL